MQAGYPKKGQCNSCGFLAKLQKHQSAAPPFIYEMPFKERQNGTVIPWNVGGQNVDFIPTCYEDVDIGSEILRLQQDDKKGESAAIREVFEKDRQCQKWRKYIHGLSPQEHWMKMYADNLETDRRRLDIILALIVGILVVPEVLTGLLQVTYPNGLPQFTFIDWLVMLGWILLPFYFVVFIFGLGLLIWWRSKEPI